MKFAGEYRDPTGLYHLRARQYDPGSGRFLTRDPVPPQVSSASTSSYAYVSNRPTVWIDPTGECPVCGVVVGGLGGAGVYLGSVALTDEEFSLTGLAASTAGGAVAGGGGSFAGSVARRLISSRLGRMAATTAGTLGAGAVGSVVTGVVCGDEPSSRAVGLSATAATVGTHAGGQLFQQHGFRVQTLRGLFRSRPNSKRIWGAGYVGGLVELGFVVGTSGASEACK